MFYVVTSRNRFVGVRLSPAGYDVLQRMADDETNGNLSEMMRTLLREAITHREARADFRETVRRVNLRTDPR